jgi:hypothetical protein
MTFFSLTKPARFVTEIEADFLGIGFQLFAGDVQRETWPH